MDPAVSLCTVPYWRKNLYNSTACVPIVLELFGGRLRAMDRDGATVFDAGVADVSSRVTRLGTLILTVGGVRYSLIGRAGPISPSPTAPQLEYARQAAARNAGPDSALPSGPNALDMVFNGAAGFHMRLWHNALTAAGARSS